MYFSEIFLRIAEISGKTAPRKAKMTHLFNSLLDKSGKELYNLGIFTYNADKASHYPVGADNSARRI